MYDVLKCFQNININLSQTGFNTHETVGVFVIASYSLLQRP